MKKVCFHFFITSKFLPSQQKHNTQKRKEETKRETEREKGKDILLEKEGENKRKHY